jgi:hypothetical protein
MEHLSSTEEHCELELVAFSQERACVLKLHFQVVRIGFGPEPDFLESRTVTLVLLESFAGLAFLFVQPLAVIHDSANGWLARRRYLDKIQTGIACFIHRLTRFQDSMLYVFLVYQPDRSCLDPSICPQFLFTYCAAPYLSSRQQLIV